MQRLQVPVYYDFASTLCYVAHRVLERMRPDLEALDLELRWSPIDLTRLTGWRRGDSVEGPGRENALRVAKELEVPVRMPHRWLDSRPASAIALTLAGTDREVRFREQVWSAVYDEGRELEREPWLLELARSLDVDPQQVTGSRGLEALEVATLEAKEAEVSGVPTFLFGEWPLGGIQEEQTMSSLFSRYASRRRGVH